MTFAIKSLIEESDIDNIIQGFVAHNWHKPRSIIEQYIKEQNEGRRDVWVAYLDKKWAGYITLNRESGYESFRKNDIPEIMDLNVLPPSRKSGLGSRLLNLAEKKAVPGQSYALDDELILWLTKQLA